MKQSYQMTFRMIKRLSDIIRKNRHRAPLLVVLCFIVVCASAETLFVSAPQHKHVAAAKNGKNVKLDRARLMIQRPNFKPLVLLDSVILYRDGAIMYCDSAYLDDATNSFEAFSNVKINQGDTLILTGDHLYYDGVYKLAKLRRNVVLEDKKAKMTLFTDSLNYDRMMNVAYYFDGGMVVDPENQLTSNWGQYEPALKLATFRDSVKLVNKKFVINSDTLQYNPKTHISTILGPAVVQSDSGVIYTNRGWYNTVSEESMLLNQSLVVNKQKTQFLTGDTIFFNREKSLGDVYGHMILQDTVRKVILKGDRGHYEGGKKFAWATKSAQALEYSQKDTLYLHADTLQMAPDEKFTFLRAFRKARFYRTDIQGIGDSIQYNSRDSVMHLFHEAVVWNDNQEVAGDTIHIFRKDTLVDHMTVKNNAYIMQQIDSVKFNQLKGRTIIAYMNGRELKHVLVSGNAESIFYPQEKDSSYVGHNQTESGFLTIDFENKKVKKLKLWPSPKATMTPIPLLKPEQYKLKDVFWLDYMRPLNKEDIFRVVARKVGDAPPKRSSRFDQEE